jgi:hypothetical protein
LEIQVISRDLREPEQAAIDERKIQVNEIGSAEKTGTMSGTASSLSRELLIKIAYFPKAQFRDANFISPECFQVPLGSDVQEPKAQEHGFDIFGSFKEVPFPSQFCQYSNDDRLGRKIRVQPSIIITRLLRLDWDDRRF